MKEGYKLSEQLTPQQKIQNFKKLTRQYEQKLPSQSFSEGNTLSFELPKTRFGTMIYLRVKGSFKVTHASKTTFTKTVFDKFNLFNQVRVEINNGFNPYMISGEMLAMYNRTSNYKNLVTATDTFNTEVLENVVSSAGTVDKIAYTQEIPFVINPRDTIGIINLQNSGTLAKLYVDCGYIKDLMTETDITISDINITVTPIIETFSIPAIPTAVPDYNIIKVVNEQVESIVGNGEQIFKIPVALTYRKMLFYFASAGNTPIDIANIGNIQLVFNQADMPYQIDAEFLAYKNRKAYQGTLPAGCFCLDFTDEGFANYGSGRDYIDTQKLTELWLKVNFTGLSGTTNTIRIVSEKLAKLV